MMLQRASTELPNELQFNKYAAQLLETDNSITASTPTITTFSGTDFLHKLSATIFNTLQAQATANRVKQAQTHAETVTSGSSVTHMDFGIAPNHVVIDSTNFGGMDELQKQLEYDKFMNEVWIGIVFTLILISLIFCMCSCFLYHQFRTWKRNFNATMTQSQTLDVERAKLNPELEDPVPEYTLVSGLPSYEAAMELLQKTSNSCVIVYPSVFNVFSNHKNASHNTTTIEEQQQQQQQHQQQPAISAVTSSLTVVDTAIKNNNNDSNNNSTIKKDSNIQIAATAAATTTMNVTLANASEKAERLSAATTTTTTTTTAATTTKGQTEAATKTTTTTTTTMPNST